MRAVLRRCGAPAALMSNTVCATLPQQQLTHMLPRTSSLGLSANIVMPAYMNQHRQYFTTTRCALGSGEQNKKETGLGPAADESETQMLKNLSSGSESSISFVARLLKAVMARMRAKQDLELEDAVQETRGILAAMRTKLEALVAKVKAAEDLLLKRFPAGDKGKPKELKDRVDAFMDEASKDSSHKK